MKPPPLQSAPPCYQKLVWEPCLCQGGGTKILGYGVRLPFLCDGKEQFCSKISVSRFAMEMGAYPLEKLNWGSKISNNIMSQVSASTKISSSASNSTQGEEEEEENDEVDDELSYFRGLVLDVSYRPVNVVCWRRAICLEFLEKADVLEYYDQTVSSPGGSFNIPAVLRVANLVQVPKRRRVKAQLSRKNIYGRDLFTCQYCRSHDNLTIDHVLPVSRGGHWNWENLVTACSECNSKKGHKTLEEANMKLIKIPKAPKDYDTQGIPLTYSTYKMLRNREKMPNEWLDYISTQFFVSS